MVKLVLACALAVAGCTYSPNFGDCRVAACESAADCPDGFTCDGQHYCRAPGASTPCDLVLVDAMPSGDASVTIDGTSGTCVGTVSACTFTTLQTCNSQSGCTWVAPTCTVTTNCSMYTTSTACSQHDECRTDFTTSTCVKDTAFCVGSTEAACETSSACLFAGGCAGTADPCTAFTNQSSCGAQMGCSWQ